MNLLQDIQSVLRALLGAAALSESAILADPVQLAARVAWGEARGGGTIGMHAVLCSIDNRRKQPGWWGSTILTVCRARGQYDCLIPGTADYRATMAVTTADPDFRTSLGLSQLLSAGRLLDITNGADSYYALGTRKPIWATAPRYRGVWGGQEYFRVGVAGLGAALGVTEDTSTGASV